MLAQKFGSSPKGLATMLNVRIKVTHFQKLVQERKFYLRHDFYVCKTLHSWFCPEEPKLLIASSNLKAIPTMHSKFWSKTFWHPWGVYFVQKMIFPSLHELLACELKMPGKSCSFDNAAEKASKCTLSSSFRLVSFRVAIQKWNFRLDYYSCECPR